MENKIEELDELKHFGVKGMKWGIRRYQNYDGTLINPKGRKRKSSNKSQQKSKKYKKYGDNRDFLPYLESKAVTAGDEKYKISTTLNRPKKYDNKKEAYIDIMKSTMEIPAHASKRKQKKLEKKRQQSFRKMTRELSDDQLNSVINRLNSENQLEREFNTRLQNTKTDVRRMDGLMENIIDIANLGISIYALKKLTNNN